VGEGAFVATLPLAALGEGERRAVSLQGIDVLLCRVEGRIYAVENRCSHAASRLDTGRLRGHEIVCPLHRGRFDVRTGACVGEPATRPIRTFEVLLEGGRIHLRQPLG
jgi:nitrite reductase/ring-hydroxylating ferredoxin subunit